MRILLGGMPEIKIFSFILSLLLISCNNSKEISFAICTDIHADIMHDEVLRLSAFIEESSENPADFIIELGDFCQPIPENKEFLDIWNSFPGMSFHVLGNHDMDVNCKDRYMDYTGMIHNYYSFEQSGYHFIVLDANYFETDSGFVDYNVGNYYAHGNYRSNIPPDQLEWLRKDLEKGDSPTVVFSHQGLLDKGNVRNKEEVRQILEESGRVIAAFSGHAHSDFHQQINGIDYLIINSMSNIWVGDSYTSEARYNAEINAKHPALKYTIPYVSPLFATVIIKNGLIRIKGVKSDFVKPGPKELGVPDTLYNLPVTSSINDREFRFRK